MKERDAEILSPEELSLRCDERRWVLAAAKTPELGWMAYVMDAVIKHGSYFEWAIGRGASPQEAMDDYCRKVTGRVLVIGANTPCHREHHLSQTEAVEEG